MLIKVSLFSEFLELLQRCENFCCQFYILSFCAISSVRRTSLQNDNFQLEKLSWLRTGWIITLRTFFIITCWLEFDCYCCAYLNMSENLIYTKLRRDWASPQYCVRNKIRNNLIIKGWKASAEPRKVNACNLVNPQRTFYQVSVWASVDGQNKQKSPIWVSTHENW